VDQSHNAGHEMSPKLNSHAERPINPGMTFELVGEPHEGFTFKARDDIKDRHLYDPKDKMGVLSSFEIFATVRVHRYVRNDENNRLYYVGISFGK
jgi:hypothetical protein